KRRSASTARPTTGSARRSTCATRTRTGSSSTATGRARNGRAPKTAPASRCSTRRSTCRRCSKSSTRSEAGEQSRRRLEDDVPLHRRLGRVVRVEKSRFGQLGIDRTSERERDQPAVAETDENDVVRADEERHLGVDSRKLDRRRGPER